MQDFLDHVNDDVDDNRYEEQSNTGANEISEGGDEIDAGSEPTIQGHDDDFEEDDEGYEAVLEERDQNDYGYVEWQKDDHT